jgi:hypothetical protein
MEWNEGEMEKKKPQTFTRQAIKRERKRENEKMIKTS